MRHVGDEDRRPQDALDEPEEHGGAELVADEARGADRDDEEEPDGERQRKEDGQAPGEPADRVLLAGLRHLCVGRDRQRAEADLERLGERDHAADHRHRRDPMALRPRDERLGGDLDLADVPRRVLGTGLRTATAQVETPRIITPSSTAWPPTGASRWATGSPSGIGVTGALPSTAARARARRRAAGQPSGLDALGGPAAEALDAAAGVDELLLAGVERMALGADLDVDIWLRRARVELVAARAVHVSEDVFRMDPGLHVFDVSGGSLPRSEARWRDFAAPCAGRRRARRP